MFSKLSLVVASLLVTLAAANYPAPPPGTADQCCETVGDKSNPIVQTFAALAGVDLSGVLSNLEIGVDCSPITVLGNVCSSTAVNCPANQPGSPALININCIPITF
ncbi:fungal hydrophobin [Mycena pura]|uniref:Hydrophobin n=1 Tax=Mycena pura TaxID=153505 RepID=A0AAD6VFY0_9AGAR|nr:fungal hydrophobin [Mycena pura]